MSSTTDQAVDLSVMDPDQVFQHGKELWESGDIERALEAFEFAKLNRVKSNLEIADFLISKLEYATALDFIDHVPDAYNSPMIELRRAQCLEEMGLPEVAASHLKVAKGKAAVNNGSPRERERIDEALARCKSQYKKSN